MALENQSSLSSYRDLLLPAVGMMRARAGRTVKDASLQMNFVTDALELVVKHEFLTRSDICRGRDYFLPKMRRRLNEALCVPVGRDAVRLQVERRALAARWEKLRKTKPRKLAKP